MPATRLAEPIDSLAASYDFVVVGSGYGGGIAASRLAGAGKRVCVLERGRERLPGEYPNTALALLEEVQIDTPLGHIGSRTGLFDVRYNKDINVVVGCGLGGTSLINAGICLRPDARTFSAAPWPAELRAAGALDRYFDRVAAMLRPSRYPNSAAPLRKMTAFNDIARTLHGDAQPVPILVNFDKLENDLNHVGATQLPCNGCGDCVTGCNYSAKNTVLMNYLPDAKRHGAHIFTEVAVRRLERSGTRWRVYVDRDGRGEIAIDADSVVLAAGTLGTTEILLRSREHGLPLSDRLGQRFSGNGDTLGFAYNTERAIGAVGFGARTVDRNAPAGPCSTTMIDFAASDDFTARLVMEDGVIPGAVSGLLAPLFAAGARVTGRAPAESFGERVGGVFRELRHALSSASSDAVQNTLFMLLLATDDAGGRMRLSDDRLRIDWPGIGDQPQYSRASALMQSAAAELNGTYIPNPVWNTLTDHNLVSGHPLGGCAMADDAADGVVNGRGQVFSASSGAATHRGLYAMDGSVVPCALGVNPLMTISALAERAVEGALGRDRE